MTDFLVIFSYVFCGLLASNFLIARSYEKKLKVLKDKLATPSCTQVLIDNNSEKVAGVCSMLNGEIKVKMSEGFELTEKQLFANFGNASIFLLKLIETKEDIHEANKTKTFQMRLRDGNLLISEFKIKNFNIASKDL